MPYCFPRSSIKFQGHTGQNITDFDPNWTFPDYRPVAAFKSLRFALFTIFPSSYYHEIFRSYYHGQKRCPCKRSRSKVKVTEVNTQLSRFRTLNSSLNSHMAMKSCTRSFVKFQGHTALKIVEFDPDWTFPDRNSSFNPPMAMKCCTKLETAEVPYCFPKSSIKFQGHTGQNITDFDPNWAFPDYRLVAAFKYLRFALFKVIHQIPRSHGTNNCQF